jgi:hypothetical protein
MNTVNRIKERVHFNQYLGRIQMKLAEKVDRETIYRMRHEVYAGELFQHPENIFGKLTDALDDYNIYIVASSQGTWTYGIKSTPQLPASKNPFLMELGTPPVEFGIITGGLRNKYGLNNFLFQETRMERYLYRPPN